jgi:hypothetical protein
MDVDEELKFGSFYISWHGFLEKRETIVGRDSLSFLRRKLAATILI